MPKPIKRIWVERVQEYPRTYRYRAVNAAVDKELHEIEGIEKFYELLQWFEISPLYEEAEVLAAVEMLNQAQDIPDAFKE